MLCIRVGLAATLVLATVAGCHDVPTEPRAGTPSSALHYGEGAPLRGHFTITMAVPFIWRLIPNVLSLAPKRERRSPL